MNNLIPKNLIEFVSKYKDNNPFNSLFYIISFVIIIVNSISYYKNIVYSNFIIITILLFTFLLTQLNEKKNKSFTLLLCLIPIIPADRIYINNLDIDSILIRIIPIIGNIYDIYYIFYKKTIEPKNGWIDKNE